MYDPGAIDSVRASRAPDHGAATCTWNPVERPAPTRPLPAPDEQVKAPRLPASTAPGSQPAPLPYLPAATVRSASSTWPALPRVQGGTLLHAEKKPEFTENKKAGRVKVPARLASQRPCLQVRVGVPFVLRNGQVFPRAGRQMPAIKAPLI